MDMQRDNRATNKSDRQTGNVGFYNTNGFSLLESLQWTEDMGMALYSPSTLGTLWAEIQFRKMRWVQSFSLPLASYSAVEVGNEAWFLLNYLYRFLFLYNSIKAQYLNIKRISTAYGSMWHNHHHVCPSYFLDNVFWDNWQEITGRNTAILLDEHAVTTYDDGSLLLYPSLAVTVTEVVNSGTTNLPLTVLLGAPYSSVNGTIITNSNSEGFNYFNNATAIVPAPISALPRPATGSNGNCTWNVPSFSINVLQFDLS
ncbi:MAG: hypothetical protein MMC33_009483 [Icmadophila ericetorum]|nr:hypothetical protein [Icmadophila ericetorum]